MIGAPSLNFKKIFFGGGTFKLDSIEQTSGHTKCVNFFQDEFNKVIYLTRKNKKDILSIDYNYDSLYGYLNFSLIFSIFNENDKNDLDSVIFDITKLPVYVLDKNNAEVAR